MAKHPSMDSYVMNGKELGPEIRDLVFRYVALPTVTGTGEEKLAEGFFLDCFKDLPYFQSHPENLGCFPSSGGGDEPRVCYALIQGKGEGTVVLIHHYDVVSTEDYKTLQDKAYSPEALEEALRDLQSQLAPEAREDLLSGQWLFGHGACDMKGGGAIQMALIRAYSQNPESLSGHVLLLAVPDEENQSAGMISAVALLNQLKVQKNLDYRMMINSEPHQRKTPDVTVFSEGSVGKMMPFVYVRGSLSHAGKVFEGLNPLGILSSIVTRTELSLDFSETVGQEAAPPPTWLYLKDSKAHYDVSMPLSAAGCFSVLTLGKQPDQVLDQLNHVCEEAFADTLSMMNLRYHTFLASRGQKKKDLPWQVRVQPVSELIQEAQSLGGEACQRAMDRCLDQLAQELKSGTTDYVQATFRLIETLYDFVGDLSPRVVTGLIPPYYPSASNRDFPMAWRNQRTLSEQLGHYLREGLGGRSEVEDFFTGISDLSYSSLRNSQELSKTLKESMPLFGRLYELPLDILESISMPCINIGPWGKDFHKLTERVLLDDLYRITPALLDQAIGILLDPEDGK